ncbi:MAG: hypothetical protein IJA69_02525, partial [Clostridia bacterium]|nr:hypothetical protein [Clostridia bacterium]
MKNKFNKLSLVFVCLALLCCCAFITPSLNANTNNQQTVYADDVPAEITDGLFSVVQSNLDGSNGQNIANNQVAFISSGEQVVATFKDPNEGIEGIAAYFTFNDETLSNAALADMGIAVEYSDTEFSITSSTALGTYAPYGKYELHIEYLYQNNLDTVDKSFDYTYYVLRASDYFVGTSVNVIKNKQSITSASGTYDNTYMFNYQDATQTTSLELPNIKFDYTKFAVTVTKNFQNSESIQTFAFNGTEVLINGDNVALYEITPDNQVSLIFNDLGSYDITYTFLYSYNQKVDTITSYTSYNGQKRERLDIFGFQLYYSDINNNGSKEFKNISSTGVVGKELTDISYMGSLNTNLILNKVSYNQTTNPNPFVIQRTNQGPLSFKYNVQLDTDNSKIYKLIPTVDENGNITYALESQAGEKYENTPLTEAGTYIIELSYIYPKHPTSAGTTFKQWFVFTLTNDTPTFSIKGANGADEHGNVIYDIAINEFINKDVQISKQGTESLFDIPTKLMVYEQTNYTGNWNQGTEVTQTSPLVVSNNANYKVTLHFGKNLAQSYSAYFVIDKTEINNIQKFSSVEV